MADLHALLRDRGQTGDAREDALEKLALDICGVAFTANAPAVLVNAFGPIAFCKSCQFEPEPPPPHR